MRILFIDPLGDKETTGLNIGIAYCATHVFAAGHTVSVLDLVNIRKPDPEAAIRNAMEKFRPEVVGISVCNMSLKNTQAYSKSIKKFFKGPVVLGGPEISALGRRALEIIPYADMAVIGEGELTLVELMMAIGNQSAMESVRGLVWRKDGNIVTNQPRDFIKDLNEGPFPDYGMFGVDQMDIYPIVTSRGCPYSCSFCFSYLGKKWRPRTPENIIDELNNAKERYRPKLFHICDPAFNIDIVRVESFCRLLIDNKINMPWVIQGFRADRVTDSMMQALRDANCKRVFVGVETLEEDVFKGINKGETLEDIKRSIALMKKYGIEIYVHMLMGLPGDTYKKTLRSFANAQKLNFDLLAYSSCVPFTGTDVERWAKDNATILADSYETSSLGTKYDRISYCTEDFTADERKRARRIINIKSGGYNEPDTHPMAFKFKKLFLILRYDFANIHKRLLRSIKHRVNYKNSVDSINLWRGIYFSRIPDGTWGVGNNEKTGAPFSKRYYLDMKRLNISEIQAK